MIVLAMVFAGLVGLIQLIVLATPTRSVAVRTALLAVGLGAYGCGVVAIAIEFAYTRALANMSDASLRDVVRTASYTAAPIVEELVKLAPLALAARFARTRSQWGLTDYVVLGGGIGVGFGLLEAVMRFGSRPDRAFGFPGGWTFPGIYPPFVPGPRLALSSWLPAPVANIPLGVIEVQPDIFRHLVWSAVAGLGLGWWARSRGRVRFLGVVPVVWAIGDHAAGNYEAVSSLAASEAMDTLVGPFLQTEPLLWVWPLLSLAVAVALDHRVLVRQRSSRPELLLPGELELGSLRLAAFGLIRPPWTLLLITRFALVRRAACYGAEDDAESPRVARLLADVAAARDGLEAVARPDAWRGVSLRRVVTGRHRSRRERTRLAGSVVVWLVLLVPGLMYYGVGGSKAGSEMQARLAGGWAYAMVVASVAVGLVWLAMRMWATVRSLPHVRTLADGTAMATAQFRLATGLGVGALAAYSLWVIATGAAAHEAVVRNYFGLDALTALLVVAALVLVVAAVVFFPPSIGVVAGASGLVAVEMSAGFVLFGGTGLTALGLATQRSLALGRGEVSPVELPPVRPPGPPLGPIGLAAAAAVGIYGALDHLLGPDSPPVEPVLSPFHYRGLDGGLYWRDTNQPVDPRVRRPMYVDDDGVLRWGDTGDPVEQPVTGSAGVSRRDLVATFGETQVAALEAAGIDPTKLTGNLDELFKVLRQAASRHGAQGELDAIARWQAEGRQVHIPARSGEQHVTNPDFIVDGHLVEVKTRSEPIGSRGVKDLIEEANDQIKKSKFEVSGEVEVQLTGGAATALLAEIEQQVRRQFTVSRSRSLHRVAVYREGDLAAEWLRAVDGTVVQRPVGGG